MSTEWVELATIGRIVTLRVAGSGSEWYSSQGNHIHKISSVASREKTSCGGKRGVMRVLEVHDLQGVVCSAHNALLIGQPCEQQVNFWQYSSQGPQNTLMRKNSPSENEMFLRQRQVVEMQLDSASTQEKNQSVSGPRVINSRADGKGRNKSQKTHCVGCL